MELSTLFRRPSLPVVTPEPVLEGEALLKHKLLVGLTRDFPDACRFEGTVFKLSPMTVSTLARVIWTINRANGFPDYAGDGIPVALVLIHDEISEAYGVVDAKGDYSDFAEELADVFIRTVDLAESVFPGEIGPRYTPQEFILSAQSFSSYMQAHLLALHELTSRCVRLFRGTPEGSTTMPPALLSTLAELLQQTDWAGRLSHTDFGTVVLRKLERNAARPYRHGGKRI